MIDLPGTRTSAPPAPLLVDEREAARLLHVHPNTVRGLHKRGELASLKVGRARRYPVDDLRRFIAEKMAEAEGARQEAET